LLLFLSGKHEISLFFDELRILDVCGFLIQAKWGKEFGCNVWQNAVCDATTELWSGSGSHEPSHRLGFRLLASNH